MAFAVRAVPRAHGDARQLRQRHALAAELVGAATIVITVDFVYDVGFTHGWTETVLWMAILAVVTVTSGLSCRAAQQSAQQQQAALDRMGRLAEANALLFSLQRVAQTLPASLDLDEVLDS